jgi:IS30 family transposase
VVAAVNQLNRRPRKVLAFKTPHDLMQQNMAAFAA